MATAWLHSVNYRHNGNNLPLKKYVGLHSNMKFCHTERHVFYGNNDRPWRSAPTATLTGRGHPLPRQHLPAIVALSQGRKKITRPSEVDGSSKPIFDGLKENITWY